MSGKPNNQVSNMVKQAEKADLARVAALAALLWPEHTPQELAALLAQQQANGAQFFVLYQMDEPAGFAQCSLRRDYVEGTASSPVGYLEGLFVKQEYRRRGGAKALLAACEQWAREQGCTEFASDCELENRASQRFHRSAGFRETNRIVCFAKKL